MLAVLKISFIPKLPSLNGLRQIVYSLAPNYFRTRGIGAHKHFVEQARCVRHLFSKANGMRLGTPLSAFICRKCQSRGLPCVVPTLECRRVVYDRSVIGKVIGRMRWHVPVCEICDHELSLDVTDPLLVDNGRKVEGFVDIPDDILLFFDATIEAA